MKIDMTDELTRQTDRVRDRRIDQVVPLVAPAQIIDELPLSSEQEDAILDRRAKVARIRSNATGEPPRCT